MILSLNNSLFGETIKIQVKIQNEIITNIDIENEKRYLIFLNPKLKELSNFKINEIAKNSLITEIIKKKELEKIYNFKEIGNIFEAVEKNYLKAKNISSKSEFIKILDSKELDYEIFKDKLSIEALWNQLIYNKYGNNIKLDEEFFKKSILNQIKNKRKKYEYNLSEIYFTELNKENLNKTSEILINSINEIGFENTANIYSISNTSKNGGLIGWVNELQISEKIKQEIIQLKDNEISKPININKGYLFIKLNSKRELKEEIDVNKEIMELMNKERSRQLSAFSIIFYKRLKKNIFINEF